MVINATCLNSRICGRTVHQTVSCGCFRHLDLHFLLSTLRHCLNFYNEKISLLYYENTRKMFQLGTKLKKKKRGGDKLWMTSTRNNYKMVSYQYHLHPTAALTYSTDEWEALTGPARSYCPPKWPVSRGFVGKTWWSASWWNNASTTS